MPPPDEPVLFFFLPHFISTAAVALSPSYIAGSPATPAAAAIRSDVLTNYILSVGARNVRFGARKKREKTRAWARVANSEIPDRHFSRYRPPPFSPPTARTTPTIRLLSPPSVAFNKHHTCFNTTPPNPHPHRAHLHSLRRHRDPPCSMMERST